MLDDHGFVAETNAANVFLVAAGVVRTPTTRACPEGITRGVVLALCADAQMAVDVGDLTLTDVYTADEVFVSGTMGWADAGCRRGRPDHRSRPTGADDQAAR